MPIAAMERIYEKGTPAYDGLLAKAVEGILGTIRSCNRIDVHDALHLQQVLMDGPLDSDAVDVLAKALHARTGLDSSDGHSKDNDVGNRLRLA